MSGYAEGAMSHLGILDEGVMLLEKPFVMDRLVREQPARRSIGSRPAEYERESARSKHYSLGRQTTESPAADIPESRCPRVPFPKLPHGWRHVPAPNCGVPLMAYFKPVASLPLS
jgi:hypothetical protein